MNNGQFSGEPVDFQQTEKKTVYTGADTVFAWVMLVLGYLTCKMLFEYRAGLGAFIVGALWCAAIPVYFAVKGVKQGFGHLLYVFVSISFTSVFFLSDNGFIKFLAAAYVLVSMIYYMYFTGSIPGKFITEYAFFDVLASAFMPFTHLVRIFPSAFRFKGKSGKRIGQAFLGILIAIIPTWIVVALLTNADAGFSNLFGKIFNFENINITKDLGWIFLGILFAMYIFGAMFYNAHENSIGEKSGEISEKASSAVRFMPPVAAFVSVIPVLIVYVMFMVVQSSYIFGGFASIRPENLTYAEYARSGFFELCAVASFNLVIILCLIIFTRRKDGKKSNVMKTFVIILSFMTLLLISVAVSKLYMYIDAYGLTVARIYPGWFMILLAFVFIFIIIKQLWNKFSYFLSLFVAFIVLFSGLCFCDIDARIAQYNVWAYTSGKTDTLDVKALAELSDSAVMYVLPLLDSNEEKDATVIKVIKAWFPMEKIISEKENESFAEWDIPTLKLLKLADSYCANLNEDKGSSTAYINRTLGNIADKDTFFTFYALMPAECKNGLPKSSDIK